MDKVLKRAKEIGVTLGIAGTIVTASAYTDISFNNAEYTKAVVENFEQKEVSNDNTPVVDLKEKKDPKIISLDSLGAGDPPFKIGNITINKNDMVTSFVDELGMYDMTARKFASTIQKIRNSEYQSQYVQVIKAIDGFVTDKKLSAKQGWALLLYITDDVTFNKMFKPGGKMQKLFSEGIARDKNVKAFYQAGNQGGYMMTGGTFNPASLNKLLAYAAKMETTRSGYSENVNTTTASSNTETVDYSQYAQYGDEMDNNTAVEEAKKRVEESMKQGREKIIKAAKGYIATGGNPADIEGWEEISEELNITPDDLK